MPDPRLGARWAWAGMLDPALSPWPAGMSQAGSREARGVVSWAQGPLSVLCFCLFTCFPEVCIFL